VTKSGWKIAPLKRWASCRPSNIDKHSVEGEPPVRLCNYVDVYKNERVTTDLELMDATASEVQIERFTLKANDVIVTKDSETPNDIAVPAHVPFDMPQVVCGYHLTLLRPNVSRLHGGFLFWALQSSEAHDYFATSALGITRFALNTTDIEQFSLTAPALDDQVRIANFLDDKTARIDALIAEKEHLLERLTEYSVAYANEVFRGRLEARGSVRLKYRCPEVTVGIVVTPAKYYVEAGVPCLRSLNVGEGYLIAENLVHISPEANELHVKSKIFAGDIVVVRSGKTGATAVVTPDFHGANCIDLVIIRASAQVDSEWLRVYLNSAPALEQVTDASEGAIQQHFNVGSARELRIPNSTLEEQRQDLADVLRVERATSELGAHVKSHIDRLREYRSSLISAAVTGQLDLGMPVELRKAA
jgi:type I restriction enzyme, S subunit